MKRLATAVCLIVLGVSPGTVVAQGQRAIGGVQTVDRVIAVVNDEVITQFDVEDGKRAVIQQLRARGTAIPPADVLEKQLLERIITERALIQFARETGLKIDDTIVERTIQRIADENKLPLADFRAAVEKEGIPYARYREDIRVEIIVSRLREREVDSRIVVTDSEVENYLATQAQAGRDEEYRLAHILIGIPEQASSEQIQERRARANEALAQLQRGVDFAQVSAGYSDAPDALRGGDLGWRPAARLPTVFVEPVKTMKIGETSGVLRSASGFHIVRFVERRGKDGPTIADQSRVRHILVRVNETMSEAEGRAKIDRVRDRLQGGSPFADQAKLNSEDPSSARGGDLGWVSAGDTVPEFEQAMNRLALNQLSEPVRTSFGWHLIEVLERRKQDVTVEKGRERARNALRERKSEEAYQDWVRQLRDRAYVEYRLDDR